MKLKLAWGLILFSGLAWALSESPAVWLWGAIAGGIGVAMLVNHYDR